MKSFILLVCLLPAVAFAEVQVTFKDGTKVCGHYIEKDKTYCQIIDGGEICVAKSELVSAATMSVCGDSEMNGDSTVYLKEHNLSSAELLAQKKAKEELERAPEYREPTRKAVKMRKEY